MNEYTFIEIKTTGFNPVLDKICFLSVTEFSKELKPLRSYSTWINPEVNISEAVSKFLGITNQDLEEFPVFSDIVDIIHPFLKGKVLGAFDDSIDTIEFLKEAFFDEDIKFKYLKRDFILVKKIEDFIHKRNLSNLYLKYTGDKMTDSSFKTKEVGEIFKKQCELIGEDPSTFQYFKNIRNERVEVIVKYLYELDSKLYFNFGKYKDKDIKTVDKNYIKWILDGDFSTELKNKIEEYLN